MVDLNFIKKLKSIKQIANIWSSRCLSWKGKITIVKSHLISQINHLLSILYIPDVILKELDNVLFKFLWNKKPARIKRSSIIANTENGGLKMPDIYSIHKVSKITWIKRLLNEDDKNWKYLEWKLLNIAPHQIVRKLDEKSSNVALTNFHKQLLQIWFSVFSTAPITTKEILDEFLFENKFITFGNKPLMPFNLRQTTGYNLKIRNIITDNGTLLSKDTLNLNLNWSIERMEYNILTSSIPKSWIKTLKSNGNCYSIKACADETLPYLRTNTILKPINLIKTKDIYWEFINKLSEPITSLDTWIEIYPFLGNIDWKGVFLLPYKIVREPYIQTFQYKILNRTLNCNGNLYKWKIKQSPNCYFCNHYDTLEHHLFYCDESALFWKKLENWIFEILKAKFNFTVCEILLGINNLSGDLILVNFLIILGKLYLNNKKSSESSVLFFEFLFLFESHL